MKWSKTCGNLLNTKPDGLVKIKGLELNNLTNARRFLQPLRGFGMTSSIELGFPLQNLIAMFSVSRYPKNWIWAMVFRNWVIFIVHCSLFNKNARVGRFHISVFRCDKSRFYNIMQMQGIVSIYFIHLWPIARRDKSRLYVMFRGAMRRASTKKLFIVHCSLFIETNRFNDLTIARFNKKTRFPFTMSRFPKFPNPKSQIPSPKSKQKTAPATRSGFLYLYASADYFTSS